jgi:hypothetical protein
MNYTTDTTNYAQIKEDKAEESIRSLSLLIGNNPNDAFLDYANINNQQYSSILAHDLIAERMTENITNTYAKSPKNYLSVVLMSSLCWIGYDIRTKTGRNKLFRALIHRMHVDLEAKCEKSSPFTPEFIAYWIEYWFDIQIVAGTWVILEPL